MVSFYPRTRTLCLNSIEIYKEALSAGLPAVRAGQSLVEEVAKAAVKELELLSELAPAIPRELAEPVFRWLSQLPGFRSSECEEKVMTALAADTVRFRFLWRKIFNLSSTNCELSSRAPARGDFPLPTNKKARHCSKNW